MYSRLSQGPSIIGSDEEKKGILSRVVDGLFERIGSVKETFKYTIKLSMVEIYMEKVRDLYDLSKDNVQIKESKSQGILLSGITEIHVSNPSEALQSLSKGLANRAVGETQMNMVSSRSHCVYMFTVHRELTVDKRVKTGKLVLVDLAGSEKVDKTGAEGRVLDEAKTINKSLSALGNVINALTCSPQGKANHIPYRDSKLTRMLQDALGGYSRTALLCCCSPSLSNAAESLSTLRFGARAKHIKALPHISCNEDKVNIKQGEERSNKQGVSSTTNDESCERILCKLREKLAIEEVTLIEELFKLEGIFFDPNSVEDVEMAYEDVTSKTISSLHQTVEELVITVDELKRQNDALKAELEATKICNKFDKKAEENRSFLHNISGIFSIFISLFGSPSRDLVLHDLKLSN